MVVAEGVGEEMLGVVVVLVVILAIPLITCLTLLHVLVCRIYVFLSLFLLVSRDWHAQQVKEKGYAVVVVAEGAGEEILGGTGKTDSTG